MLQIAPWAAAFFLLHHLGAPATAVGVFLKGICASERLNHSFAGANHGCLVCLVERQCFVMSLSLFIFHMHYIVFIHN